MITAPTNWNDLETAVDSKMELKVVIAGQHTFYDEDLAQGDTKITHALYDALSIGNAASAEFTCTILNLPSVSDGILSVVPYVRWSDRDGDVVTDWVQQGQFWLDQVKINQDKSASLTAYDSLMLAEQQYFPSGVGDETQWPQPASAVVSYICGALWTSLDSRSSIPNIQIQYPGGKTMRQVLQEVATAAGGNFTMTKAGQLRLIPIAGNDSFVSLQDITVTDIETTTNFVGVTQVILKDGSAQYSSGNDNGYTVEGNFAGADQQMADDLLLSLSGVSYQGFNVSGALFSALLELGDCVSTTIGTEEYFYTFDSYSCLYEGGCWGDIEAPMDTDVTHRIRFSNAQAIQTPVEQAVQQAVENYGLKVVSVAVLPATQEPNTIYLVQGSPN